MTEKADFTTQDLPKNRFQMLLDVLKHDFFLVLRISLMQAVYAIPLIVVTAIIGIFFIALPKEQLLQSVFPLVFWGGIVAIPFFGLYFVGLSGGYSVAKKRVFGQGSLFAPDFIGAIKTIGKRCFACGMIVGISFFVFTNLTLFMLSTNAEPIAKGLAIGIAFLQFAIVRCLADYFICAQCVYELDFFSCLKNSFLFSLVRFAPNCLGLLLFTIIPIALSLLNIWVALIVVLLCMLMGGFCTFVKTLYAHNVFDKYINSIHYPEYVRKGLAK